MIEIVCAKKGRETGIIRVLKDKDKVVVMIYDTRQLFPITEFDVIPLSQYEREQDLCRRYGLGKVTGSDE